MYGNRLAEWQGAPEFSPTTSNFVHANFPTVLSAGKSNLRS